PRSSARVRPTGPPPTTRTSVWSTGGSGIDQARVVAPAALDAEGLVSLVLEVLGPHAVRRPDQRGEEGQPGLALEPDGLDDHLLDAPAGDRHAVVLEVDDRPPAQDPRHLRALLGRHDLARRAVDRYLLGHGGGHHRLHGQDRLLELA